MSHDLTEAEEKKLHEILEQVPEGKIRTSSGEIIDRTDACFRLREFKDDKSLLMATDGTVYKAGEGGTLKRLSFKINEKLSKSERKKKRREHFQGKENNK